MNEMKHFFNTTSVDTIGECLNGEKLLNFQCLVTPLINFLVSPLWR